MAIKRFGHGVGQGLPEPIDIASAIARASATSAGGIAVFLGVTRAEHLSGKLLTDGPRTCRATLATGARALEPPPERAVNAIAMHHFPIIADTKRVGPTESNPYFLSVVLQLSDSIADAYGGLDELPMSFFVDRTGKVIAVQMGLTSKADIESNIKKALAE